jgi:hypothetical protein
MNSWYSQDLINCGTLFRALLQHLAYHISDLFAVFLRQGIGLMSQYPHHQRSQILSTKRLCKRKYFISYNTHGPNIGLGAIWLVVANFRG